MPDGSPHPFIWYGRYSNWVENEHGVFHCDIASIKRRFICKLTGYHWWEIQHHTYSDIERARAAKSTIPVMLPALTLQCRICKARALPWKLWS